jgi:carnitine O-acetyltransferase
LQFVVCENGVSGYICENTALGALSAQQLNKCITQAIIAHKPESQGNGTNSNVNDVNNVASGLGEHTRYTFAITADLRQHISRVHDNFRTTNVPAEITHLHITPLNMPLFRKYKIPSKGGCQVVIQLASLFYFGQNCSAWEAVSLGLFHKGRLDWIQIASPAMVAFCQSIHSSLPIQQKRALLVKATQAHASTMTRVSRGRGFLAHLEMLKSALRPDETVPELFTDPTWAMMSATSPRKIKTDAVDDMMMQEGGFSMPDLESVLVHYEVEDAGCKLFVQGTKGRTEKFCAALEMAADIVQGLLGA